MCNKVEDAGMLFNKMQDDANTIKAVRKLHSKMYPHGLLCTHCNRRYPCSTIKLLGEEMSVMPVEPLTVSQPSIQDPDEWLVDE